MNKDESIVHLPQDLFLTKKEKEEPIVFHKYIATTDSMKGKSILHKNAISLVIFGKKTMHFSNQTVHIYDNEFHFLSAGNCLASVNISNQKIFQSILIFFDTKMITDFYLKYAKRIDNLKSKKIRSYQPYLSFKKDEFVNKYIDSLNSFFQSDKKISIEMKLLKWEELMLYLLENNPEKILSFQASQPNFNNELEIKKVIETNLTNAITIEELAFLCNMSLSTFKRKFLHLYGIPPSKWILQQRMEIAKKLLIHNEKPSEVYYKIGYETHSSFAHSFKQIVGLTPKEFQLQELNVHL